MDDKPRFVYVTYISSTPEKIWQALTDPQTTAKYWYKRNLSDWKPGSRWEHRDEEKDGGGLRMVGKVVESTPPRRLVISWAAPDDEAKDTRHTRVTFEIEKVRDVVRLTVIHDRLEPDSEMLRGITDGWPKVLSSLKSMLETGRALSNFWTD
jgi:uncharacterized protein YndB with AHSA1/START domain